MSGESPPNEARLTQQSDSTIGGTEQRLGPLVGDRLCIECGYNLAGQQIVREPHYRMLIVRCSECGTVAAIQEYPILGRWATRWAVVLAGLWLLVLLFLWGVFSGVVFGMTYDAIQSATSPYALHLATLQRDWAEEQGLLDNPQTQWQYQPSQYSSLDEKWWATQNSRELLNDVGGWAGVINWRSVFSAWLMLSMWLFIFGVVWSLLLPHVRRRWLPLTVPIIVIPSALMWIVSQSYSQPFMRTVAEVASEQIGWYPVALFLAFAAIVIGVGTVCGRSIARLAIRVLLPPRMRGALAPVWLIDGLNPPSGKLRHRSL